MTTIYNQTAYKQQSQRSFLIHRSFFLCLDYAGLYPYQCRRHGFHPWIGTIPWRRKWLHISVFLPGKSHGQRSLVGYGPWGYIELDMTQQVRTHAPLRDHVCIIRQPNQPEPIGGGTRPQLSYCPTNAQIHGRFSVNIDKRINLQT